MLWCSGSVFLTIVLSMFTSRVLSLVPKSSLRISRLARQARSPLSSCTSPPYDDSERLIVKINAQLSKDFDGDLLVIPFYKPAETSNSTNAARDALRDSIPSGLSVEVTSVVADVINEGLFKADVLAVQVTRNAGSTNPRYIALLGLGPDPKVGVPSDVEVSSALRMGRTLSSLAKEYASKKVAIVAPPGLSNAGVTQLVLGLHDGAYKDTRFQKKPEPGLRSIDLTILGAADHVVDKIKLTHSLTEKIASGVHFAKDLVGAPANMKTPVVVAEQAQKIARENDLQCTILGEAECRARGMGGYLGVQQGSRLDPQFIHLTYTPDAPGSSKPLKIAFVGKGLTFDSGGYNLKVGAGSQIELMKFDMAGCAAVLGCAKAIGQLRPKNVEVHWISAVCENMISAKAMRPGDILTASNGKTIEVINTDAEGRLTLADALVYAEQQGVDIVVDLATLTGACVVGLGEKLAGLYSPDKQLRDELEAAGARADEGIWPMPLERSYHEYVKSSLADLKNVGAKGGGSITAALFLQEFVDKVRWAHIDMAGPCWDSSSNKPTGYGVKLLVDFLLNAKK